MPTTRNDRPLLTKAAFRALAIALVGLAYVLGQPIPYNRGRDTLRALDCSGLICWLLYWAGCGIGDTTAAVLYNRSVPSEPRVGALVFLRNNPARSNGIGHVAIITAKLSSGDWEIVEARGRSAGVVRTTLTYWKSRRYYAGIRHLPALQFATPTPAPTPAPTRPAKLAVDGDFGTKTATALQWWLRVPQSGALNTATRKALQRRLRVTVDGLIGPKTITALQKTIGSTPDGRWGTATTKALQRYLNSH